MKQYNEFRITPKKEKNVSKKTLNLYRIEGQVYAAESPDSAYSQHMSGWKACGTLQGGFQPHVPVSELHPPLSKRDAREVGEIVYESHGRCRSSLPNIQNLKATSALESGRQIHETLEKWLAQQGEVNSEGMPVFIGGLDDLARLAKDFERLPDDAPQHKVGGEHLIIVDEAHKLPTQAELYADLLRCCPEELVRQSRAGEAPSYESLPEDLLGYERPDPEANRIPQPSEAYSLERRLKGAKEHCKTLERKLARQAQYLEKVKKDHCTDHDARVLAEAKYEALNAKFEELLEEVSEERKHNSRLQKQVSGQEEVWYQVWYMLTGEQVPEAEGAQGVKALWKLVAKECASRSEATIYRIRVHRPPMASKNWG